jgi:hypothetical protein
MTAINFAQEDTFSGKIQKANRVSEECINIANLLNAGDTVHTPPRAKAQRLVSISIQCAYGCGRSAAIHTKGAR